MMRFYARGGKGRVYWLLLPQARGGFFRRAYPAINAALRIAASPPRDHVRLVHLNRMFTPGGRYRPSMRWRGRRVTVRQGDGVHLSTAGAAIAAGYVLRRMGRDHVLRPRRKVKRRRRPPAPPPPAPSGLEVGRRSGTSG
jgi:hypothetical protein